MHMLIYYSKIFNLKRCDGAQNVVSDSWERGEWGINSSTGQYQKFNIVIYE